MKRRKDYGFTLAEVLITLGIIGVVAAMTIPTLIHRIQAIKLRSQFLKSYSTLKQISKLMQADGLTGDANEYPPHATYNFMNTIRPYFTNGTSCGNAGLACFGKYINGDYTTMTKGKYGAIYARMAEGSILLPNGTIFFIKNQFPIGTRIWVSVDINGYNSPPNRAGYDLFFFQLMDDAEFIPLGAEGTEYTDSTKYCNQNKYDPLNGLTCANEAAKNPDYFKNLTWK